MISLALAPGEPPRARRRHRLRKEYLSLDGGTPACAGETRPPSWLPVFRQVYPACAGETGSASICRKRRWVNLRMRGGDTGRTVFNNAKHGKPPPARGRPALMEHVLNRWRGTSACAGEAYNGFIRHPQGRGNPRMRGGDSIIGRRCSYQAGEPPPARRRRRQLSFPAIRQGWTSACAEKTWRLADTTPPGGVNLRLRGGSPGQLPADWRNRGEPPPARRKRSGWSGWN